MRLCWRKLAIVVPLILCGFLSDTRWLSAQESCAPFDGPLSFIWFQPQLIRDTLELSRDSETKNDLEKYFSQQALPYFQANPTALGNLYSEVSGWMSETLKSEFVLPNEEEFSQKIATGRSFSSAEKTLLIYGTAIATYDLLESLRQSQANNCLNDLDALLASSVAMTEQVMLVKNSFYESRRILAEAMLQNILIMASNDFDQLKARIVSAYPKIYAGYSDELNDIYQWAGKRELADSDALNIKKIAVLSVMMQIMTRLPAPDVYTWSAEDLDLIKQISMSIKGEIGDEVRRSILKNSRAYALANTKPRPQRMLGVLDSNWGTIAIGGAGLALYVMTKDYAVLTKGFARAESIYINQVAANAPKEIAAGANFAGDVTKLWTNPSSPIPAWANTAAREAIQQARFDFAYRAAFKNRVISLYGQNAWTKVEPIFNDKVVGTGTKLLSDPTMDDLASALSKVERGGMSVRQSSEFVREMASRMEVNVLTDTKAMDKAMKVAHQEMRITAEAAMGEDFLQKAIGAKPQTRLGLWFQEIYKKARGRLAMRAFAVTDVQELSKAPWYNPVARLRNWWSARSVSASTVVEGSAYKGVLPGESVAVKTASIRTMTRSVLKFASRAMIAYAVGKLAYDSYKAFYVRSPEMDFEDLREKSKAAPMDDVALEKSFKTLHLSSLAADLANAFDHAQGDANQSLNEARFLNNQSEIEVVVSPAAASSVERMTGFIDYAYVLFKVREKSRDSTWDLRRQNAVTGVLVRFKEVREGFDQKLASELRLKKDVPSKIYWEFDKMVVLNGLDPNESRIIQEAISFSAARADDPHPEILIDAEKAKALFVGED